MRPGTFMTDLSAGTCVGSPDAELWFSRQPEDIALAKRICSECPVRLACAEGALMRGEQFGIFGGIDFERDLQGGMSALERAELLREQSA